MLELPADATRQYIDAVATFEAYEEALAEAAKDVLAQGAHGRS